MWILPLLPCHSNFLLQTPRVDCKMSMHRYSKCTSTKRVFVLLAFPITKPSQPVTGGLVPIFSLASWWAEPLSCPFRPLVTPLVKFSPYSIIYSCWFGAAGILHSAKPSSVIMTAFASTLVRWLRRQGGQQSSLFVGVDFWEVLIPWRFGDINIVLAVDKQAAEAAEGHRMRRESATASFPPLSTRTYPPSPFLK